MKKILNKHFEKYLNKEIYKDKAIIKSLNDFCSTLDIKEQEKLNRIFNIIKEKNVKILFCQDESYFDVVNNMIYIQDIRFVKFIYLSFLHELGHCVDYNVSRCKISSYAITIFIKELNDKKIYNQEDAIRYIETFDNKVKFNSIMFDSICILYNIDARKVLCTGHDLKYSIYFKDIFAGAELFAEFFKLKFLKEEYCLELFKREFPKTYSFLEKKFKEL